MRSSEFSRNWGKKWVPRYTTFLAYLTTVAQPFPILWKILAIVTNINNHPHLIKINTDTKSPMSLTRLVL